jgi:multisubunit Na+/H+ antiporter MnhF subunit
MNSTWVAIVLAVLAIALAAFCIYRIYAGTFKQDQVEGLDAINANASSAIVKSTANAANISRINEQLGVVDEATSGFTSLAGAAVTPSFPLTLG